MSRKPTSSSQPLAFPDGLASLFAEVDARTKGIGSSPLATRCTLAREKVSLMGLPSLANEEWRYTNIRPLTALTWTNEVRAAATPKVVGTHPALLQSSGPLVVFVNGHFDKSRSRLEQLSTGLKIEILSNEFSAARTNQAEGNLAARIERLLAQRQRELSGLPTPVARIGEEADWVATLGTALLNEGVVITAKRGATLDQRINVVHVHTGQSEKTAKPANVASAIRIFIVAEESSSLDVVETWTCDEPNGDDAARLTLAHTDAFVASNARLRHARLQGEDLATWHLGTIRASVARDARLETFNLATGSRLGRTGMDIMLTGEGAHATVDGLYVPREKQHVDFHTAIDHRSPHTASSQLYKGILFDSARAVFNGKIFVRRDAQQTSAFQTNKNLLLGAGAEVDTKPQLEIDADDVKCSHGATVGQLSEQELFYLRSRGIPKAQATTLLCEAFAADALGQIESVEVREKMGVLLRDTFAAALRSTP